MKRFRNILVIYGDGPGSDDALGQAVALAQTNGAALTVAGIVTGRDCTPGNLDEAGKRLRRLAAAVPRAAAADVGTVVLAGAPHVEAIRQVLRARHDLVIASAEGGSVLANAFFGSLATNLMRKCPCPVWIVKPGQAVPYGKVLAAVDPRPDDPDGDELTVRIMDLASSMAAADGADLHVVQAWDVEGTERDTVHSETPRDVHREILHRHESMNRERLDRLLSRYDLTRSSPAIHLCREPAQRAIIDVAAREAVDVIVMGTVSRSPIHGFLLGSTAEAVLGAVRCGMMTVKPAGFVSAVTLDEDEGEPERLRRAVGA